MKEAPAWTPPWLYPHILWSGLRGLLVVLPLSANVLRGGLHYLMPFQYQVHIMPLVTISQGKIGYLHLAAMQASNQAQFEREAYEYIADKEGMILDVRFNKGGNIADTLPSVAVSTATGLPAGACPTTSPA